MEKFLIFVIIALIKFSQGNIIGKRDIAEIPVNSCVSAPGEWKCCTTSPPIHDFKLTGCINIEFIQNTTKWLKLKISLNNHIFLEEKFSDTFCYHIPYLKKMAQVCLNFYDPPLFHSNNVFSKCTRFSVKIVGRQMLNVHVGCFEFPLNTIKNEEKNSILKEVEHETSVTWDTAETWTTEINHNDIISKESEEGHKSSTYYDVSSETELPTADPIWSPFSFKFPKNAPIESDLSHYYEQPLGDIKPQKTAYDTTTIVLFSVLILCIIFFSVFTVFIIKRYRGVPIRYSLFT